MSVTVKINTVDQSDKIDFKSLSIKQNLTNKVDLANFKTRKYGSRTLQPAFDDDIEILDGATKIFGGKVMRVDSFVESGGAGQVFSVQCVDHTAEADRKLVTGTYEDETIEDIIDDVVSQFAPGFTTNNVSSTLVLEKIVFNQVPLSTVLKRLAALVQYDWYIDPDKDVHFFSKEINTAPFDLTDDNGNYVYKSLKRISDGSQLVNTVKVRGGEYDGATFTDDFTVNGSGQKSFKLPYKMANLTIQVDTGGGFVSKTVGKDFEDDFTGFDVLHDFENRSYRFNAALNNGDIIRYSGNPRVRVFAGAEDSASIIALGGKPGGVIEKLIRDDNIRSNQTARDRARAELLAFAEEVVDAKFLTYESGLRSGMLINAQSTKSDFDDDLLIKTISFKMHTTGEFKYNVELISTKRFGLIETLQKLLDPEALDVDDSEVSEQLFLTSEIITIDEDIQMVTPQERDETITIVESILLDPVAPGNVVFVLAPYAPSSQSDTKRPGRLSLSFTVY